MAVQKAVVRRLGGLAGLVALFLFLQGAGPTWADQIDHDPTNDTQAGADSLAVPVGSARQNLAVLQVSDVDFFSTQLDAGEVLLGMTTFRCCSPNWFSTPDTMAGIFSGGALLAYNDDDGADSSPIGPGYGSLFRHQASSSGTYRIGVTGTGDEDFDGVGHTQEGAYALTIGRVNPAVLGGGFADTDPLNNGIFPAIGRPGPFAPDVISLAPVSARVTVAELVANDIDFYELNLNPGDILSAMTAPLAGLSSNFDTPDTVLALFNSAGVLVFSNDDAGNEGEHSLDPDLASDNPFVTTEIRGSALRFDVPTGGKYYLAVTGYSDVDYIGSHGQLGRYALLVGRIPEPSSLLLVVGGGIGLLGLRKRVGRRLRR